MADPVTLNLTEDEAVVLFELLSRYSKPPYELTIEDEAEQRVLWDLCAMLEHSLVEPFQGDYTALLLRARSRVRDRQ